MPRLWRGRGTAYDVLQIASITDLYVYKTVELRAFDLKASRNWCWELSLPFLSFSSPCSSFLICMVISARSNWFIDPLNPVSCERRCKPELWPVSFLLPVSLQFVCISTATSKGQKCLQKHDKSMWWEIRPSFSRVCGDWSLLGYYAMWIGKYRHFGGVCLHLQGSSRNWPEKRSNALLWNACRFTSWHGFIPEDASSSKWLLNGVIYF